MAEACLYAPTCQIIGLHISYRHRQQARGQPGLSGATGGVRPSPLPRLLNYSHSDSLLGIRCPQGLTSPIL